MMYEHISPTRCLQSISSWLLLVTLLVGSSSICPAQVAPAVPPAAPQFLEMAIFPGYIENELNRAEVRMTVNRHMGAINDIVQGRRSLDGNEAAMEQWFGGYIFARMTQFDKLGELDKMRIDFFKRYLVNVQYTASRNNVATHDYLVGLTLQKMQEIAEGNYHPAVRFNAMLTIGRLNSVEAFDPTTGARVVPLPSRQALGYLVNQLQVPNQMDALQLAAWIGILRHTTLDRHHSPQNQIPVEGKDIIRGLATGLIQQQDPPPGRSPQGHTWLQRRGIDVLAMLGTDPDAQILSAIEAFAADDNSPMSLRLTAARSLANFKYDAQTTIAAIPAAYTLGSLAARACRNEITRVDDAKRKKNRGQKTGEGGTGMQGGMEGMEGMAGDGGAMEGMFGGGGPGAETENQLNPADASIVQYTRRRLKYQLFYIQQGLGTANNPSSGLMMAADAQGRLEVQKVADKVNAIMQVLAEPKLTAKVSGDKKPRKPIELVELDKMMKEVRNKMQELEELVVKAGKPVIPVPMADPAVPDGPGGN
jgi:hypothetical protein